MEDKLWNSNYLKIWIGNFLTHFAFTLVVPILPLYLTDEFGADKQMIGLCLAGYSVMSLIIRPFSGYLVDTLPRKIVLLVCNFVFFSLFAGYIAAGTITVFTIFRTLHGLPFGAATVSASTVAVDVLPSSRRTEGIGYFGLSNNLATAIGPVIAIELLHLYSNNFKVLFWLSMISSLLGLIIEASIKFPVKQFVQDKKVISLDRFFLLKGWRESISILCFAFSFGVLNTYVAIYGREVLGITKGTGLFFSLFAIGLIVSRLTGAHALRKNLVSRNASIGVILSLSGFLTFASLHNPTGYFAAAFIIGLGNGHMYPAFQNMFINLAEHNRRGTANSSILTAWDLGVGIGVLCGGIITEKLQSYSPAFWTAFGINALGVLYYFLVVRNHFEKNRLR